MLFLSRQFEFPSGINTVHYPFCLIIFFLKNVQLFAIPPISTIHQSSENFKVTKARMLIVSFLFLSDLSVTLTHACDPGPDWLLHNLSSLTVKRCGSEWWKGVFKNGVRNCPCWSILVNEKEIQYCRLSYFNKSVTFGI